LTTARLGFRCWRSDDLDPALSLWADPEVMRFTAGTPPTVDIAGPGR
jgi:RimJ/RimL family protein N-acetyltransferase